MTRPDDRYPTPLPTAPLQPAAADGGHHMTARLLGHRYEMGALLGRGGMADVHVGRDTRLGRAVAIKVLRSDLARDPSFQARFRREAQSAAGLNHPSVVAVYDSGEELSGDGSVRVPYIVMEYVEGRTLRDVLSGGHRVPWREALRMTSGVLAALAYSHRAGLVHRDIKPANVMLTPAGDIKVMDFGIARAIADSSATMTQTQAVIGTAQYLSPEQARGEQVDARSDLYSTGCLLYELLTSRPPFVADSPVAVAYQHVGEAPTAPSVQAPDVPPAVDAIVLHALRKDRAARYQNADDFRDDIEAAVAGRRISAAALGAASSAGAATEAIAVPGAGARGLSATSTLASSAALPAGSTELSGRVDARRSGRADKPNRTGLWVLLALVGAALLAVGVLVLPAMLSNQPSSPPQVTVPDVTGRPFNEAVAELRRVGLQPGARTDQASSDVPEGSVISTDPSSPAQADRGSRVAVVVSTGPEAVEVPILTGKTEQEAQDALKDLGLEIEVEEVDSGDQDAGTVVGSTPPQGARVDPGSTVTVQVVSGKVQVPNVVGLTFTDANEQLTERGFKVADPEYQVSTESPPGEVIAQDPGTGNTVKRGATIKLTIAQAPPTASPTTPGPTPTTTTPTSPP
ncbi:MAG: Stk1 family PASTA domain-containing Ser/Thr kinase [Angustibacter sp.]